MRTLWCSIAAFACVLGICASSAMAQGPRAISLRIVSVANSGRLSIELNNISPNPIRIWKDANSWGAARWRVMVLRTGQLDGFFQNPNQAFTRNGPGFTEIAAGSHVEQKIDLNDGRWCVIGDCSSPDQRDFQIKKVNFKQGDVLIVIYDVPLTGEAQQMNVWYGVVATSTTVQ